METRISTRLKALRKNLSLSSTQVIKLLSKENISYSIQTIYKWEEGSMIPSFETLKALSKIYNCNISYLLDGKEYECKRITPVENTLLTIYRTDFLFRSISTMIIKLIERD